MFYLSFTVIILVGPADEFSHFKYKGRRTTYTEAFGVSFLVIPDIYGLKNDAEKHYREKRAVYFSVMVIGGIYRTIQEKV